ncbi:Sodium channel protein type 2 subunit alpha,Sodium channel protein type 10 subunit alpha,Sodium channel protein type 4 subunit alpha B,Sodium channel protein type 9 subunit alpha,Sodium channel protein type 1 subunit alpha,Sodium channel protein type 8 subunit alpha,Sodium channel protein 60E,Sodium channel protein,Sodium channel protein 1 brain,Sodium channel protein para,Sodium channel protein PaFPC1,Sodium channel protein type 11 subunit alpha,Sodium channel protein type 4 subunit alpha,Sodium channel p|uniref:Sodium channel protein para n=1 Tax=Lepeophtheirus salmonis TaxID=72036 RepID=A0A7R8CNP4_LEPSM|nr:Sodium channel protein type 2 subunit alpha,Sodium channel protein type 10 subunit alpha,Sodium channel protein type 4 subunit alpha B,Sodium channel protein type 9 subunit alpha,Sodium channel protein type 1 subunit alpha,Sodium channel protein type 8 subunit alpha,Sodium channel protein 60E,Sodium channel protein,Sodium channel protein 1 brain,Sodium channel protein para,Sodium channel protein PaFPC1,Sodium channel protein type 11 subunit alpha,Sodium channel protein type 4 subunit alpha,Sodiu
MIPLPILLQVRYDDDDDDDGPIPDPTLEAGMPLPIRMAAEFPPELVATPIVDIDSFYSNKKTFIVISKGRDIFRFNAEDALYVLSPFSPVRRVAIHILVHPFFSVFIITTILLNCLMMIKTSNERIESSEVIFTAIYTFESATKVMGRGFILCPFSYLRDAWNWLDFIVITLAYITMGIDLGNLAVLRTFRVLRALKTVAIIPGLKTIVGAVIESVKNLRDVIILTVFSLSVFALLGLQIYMGVLTQKCIHDFPWSSIPPEERGNYSSHIAWNKFNLNSSNWYWIEGRIDPVLCGNSSGAGECPDNYTCLQGFGRNPNYDYTSFDTFGWAFLSAFRLMTQDLWEDLYQSVLRTAGPWHVIFFLVIIFLGSFYLVNLILAIVAMSYDELQKKAEEEEEAAQAEEEALREAEEAAAIAEMKLNCNFDEEDEDESEEEDEKPYENDEDELSCTSDLQHFKKDSYSKIVTPSSVLPEDKGMMMGRRCPNQHEWHITPNADTNDKDVDKFDDLSSYPKGQPPDFNGTNGVHYRRRSQESYYSNPFISPNERHASVNIKDVLVLNDIINQASARVTSTIKNPESTRSSRQLERKQREARKISLYLEAKHDEEGPRVKEKLVAWFDKCIDIFCVWDCCWAYVKLTEYLSFIIFDPFVDLFITLCILVNTFFMGLDHHDMDPDIHKTLQNGNYVSNFVYNKEKASKGKGRELKYARIWQGFFTATFAIESCIKLMAMSPKYYFLEGWNIFDFIIVSLSLIELGLVNVSGLTVLRTFRLLRVFKLAKSWPTLNLLISIMGKNLMGMQLFGKSYVDNIDRFPNKSLPRWNFVDFMHSFMIVFRVLCGEWIESMWDCMWIASKLFYFQALVLQISRLQEGNDEDTNKLSEAFNRLRRLRVFLQKLISRGLKYVKDKIILCFRQIFNARREALMRQNRASTEINQEHRTLKKDQHIVSYDVKIGDGMDIAIQGENGDIDKWQTAIRHHSLIKLKNFDDFSFEDNTSETSYQQPNGGVAGHRVVLLDDSFEEDEEDYDYDEDYEAKLEKEIFDATAQEILMHEYPSECCPDKFYLRLPFLAGDPDSPFWQGWGNLRIKNFSSLALALEDVYLPSRPVLQDVLYYMDRIFTVIFFLEMCVKWLALGFVKYFTNAWCWLDFVIVMFSILNLTIRTLRGLRPLRALSRIGGMKVVVNALVQAIPSIFNVLLVCLIFWLIFAIMGVQMFAGKYYKCEDAEGNRLNASYTPDKETCLLENQYWVNSGWTGVLYDALDSSGIGQQPIREVNLYMYWYFVFFIIFGSFFTLNLFIGVIIDNFNEQKKKITGGSLEMFMTDDQKKYYAAMKKMGNKKPVKATPRPKWKPQAVSEMWSFALDNLNIGFIVIFTTECVLKIFALRLYYFREPWNIFDFVVVILSILGIVLSDLIEKILCFPNIAACCESGKNWSSIAISERCKGNSDFIICSGYVNAGFIQHLSPINSCYVYICNFWNVFFHEREEERRTR